jgi:hypothetical protein
MACRTTSGTSSRFLAASLGLFLVTLASTTPAAADKRVALVFGNSAYQHVNKLPNPAKDAASMAEMLKQSGFDVVDAKQDVGNAEMRRMIRDFSDKVREADVALVFYAGHGIEIDGINYLLPVDTKLERDVDVEDEAVSLDRIVRILDPAKKLRLVILDACRDNPFQQTMKRSLSSRGVERGLAKVEPQSPNTLIAYAAKAGSTASDGDDKHSPFTTALLQQLPIPGQDIRRSLGYVRDEVLKSTANRQEPFVYGSLGGDDVVLVPGATRPAAPVPAQVAALDPNSPIRMDYELAAQINTQAGWDAFLKNYPKGFYADLALAARNKLGPAAKQDVAQANPEPRNLSPASTASPESFSAEAVPFVGTRVRIALASEYAQGAASKAMALNITGFYAFVVAQRDEEAAKSAALEQCQQRADAAHSIRKCEIYAVGDRVVYPHGRPPVPQGPWIRHDPSTEKPFVAKDLPLIPDSARASFATTYPQVRKPKSIAVSPKGLFYYMAGTDSVEDATRRSLESCGALSGDACMIVAVDDVFVVPLPTTAKATGFFEAAGNSSIARDARSDVANKLAEAPSGWNAVAVGAGGRPGLGLKASSEANAVREALAACARHDSDCHVIAILPFSVGPN